MQVKMTPNDAIPIRVAKLLFADTSMPLLRMAFRDTGKDASDPDTYASITITKNASTGSKLAIFVDIGASATSYIQYQMSAHATKVADPRGICAAGSVVYTQCTTLGALITALNAVPGLICHRMHGPADYSLDTDDFINLAVTRLSPLFSTYLYRDSATTLTTSMRIGVPEDVMGKIGRGKIELISVNAYVNTESATSCTFKMSYDPTDVSASDEEELAYTRLVPDSTWTELWNFHEAPPVLQGPILIEITDTTSMAQNAEVVVHYRSCEH